MPKLAILCLAGLLGGCVYANVNAPLSYRSPTPGDVSGRLGSVLTGEACNEAVLGLVAWGDGGYAAAIADAKEKSGAEFIADVTADTRFFNILGIYQKSCTRVTGRAVMR